MEQDYLRRVLLREWDVPGAANIGLIEQTARYALDHGFHVVLDGILDAARYAAMLQALHRDYAGRDTYFYLDVSFEETARRHASRPQAAEFGVDDMRGWYRRRDLLPFVAEVIVPETSTLDETVALVLERSGLGSQARRAHA